MGRKSCRVPVTCKVCQQPFTCIPAKVQVYCSMACRLAERETRRETVYCPICNTPVVSTAGNPRKYCSKPCYRLRRPNRIDGSCQRCGEPFSRKESKGGLFCSMACRRALQRETQRVSARCKQCGQPFSRKKSLGADYCSEPCYRESQRKYDPATASCEACGAAFTYPLSPQGARRYCSRQCYGKAKWQGKTYPSECAECGKDFLNTGWRVKRYCSRNCHRTAKAADYVTKPCPYCRKDFTCKTNWPVIHCSRKCQRAAKQEEIAFLQQQPGYWRTEQDRPYYGTSWPAARRAARARDKVCADCNATPGQAGRELSVHHQIPFRRFGLARHLEANALSNLISLCQSCHAIREGWGNS